ncbi:MAG: hypothetical protein KDD47_18220, partial [Acidobacteria bacterium]|nr:hypothetical protein [Acidobacteriota bacterium]
FLPGCAAHRKPATPATGAAEAAAAPAPPADSPPEDSLRDLCRRKADENEPTLDASRRLLQETVCGATLWLDGLFGGEPDVANARDVSGRLELSNGYTEHDGYTPRIRLRVRLDLPTLENRFHLFLGRDNEDDVVQDRQEGFAVRSAFFGLDEEDTWLAGLGYRPPGKWRQRIDFRVGGRLRSAPEVYVQGRFRRNHFVGHRSAWRFRETLFLDNREGFGGTTEIAFDHVPIDQVLMRWSNLGTYSEESEGLEWGSFGLLYWKASSVNALGFEVFVRGATGAEVPLKELGSRVIFRRPVFRRWLYGEIVGGYSWPRESLAENRLGSAQIGVNLEILFGRDPY